MRMLARTALRQRTSVLAPLLLCAIVPPVPRPELVIDELIPELSTTAGLELGNTVEERLRLAWQDAWEEQIKDIDELCEASAEQELDLQQLLKDSENVTLSGEAGTTGEQARRADLTRARAVTRELMRFWRFSTTRTDQFLAELEGELDAEELAELRQSAGNVTEEEARQQRRRLLQRHQAAGVVEYRIFGEVLARDEVLLDALPGVELQTFQDAWRQLGGLSNLTGWADQFEAEATEAAAEEAELMEEMKKARLLFIEEVDVNMPLRDRIMELRPDASNASLYELEYEELERQVLALEVETGEIFWNSWWVPDQIGRFCEAVYYATSALEEGALEPSTSCGPWLSLVGSTIRRSAAQGFAPADGGLGPETNAFPLLLLLVCVGRQGHIEAAAVYAMARAIGTLNSKAIAAHEGFDVSTAPDARVSEAEASNTIFPIVVELFKLLQKEVGPFALPIFLSFLTLGVVSSFLTFGVPLLLLGLAWSSSTELFTALFELLGFTGGAAVDPLVFVG